MNENATAGSTVERVAAALHRAQIRCSPNIPKCRASHRGHAGNLTAALSLEGIYLVSRDELAEALMAVDPVTFPIGRYAAAILEALEQPR